MGQQKKQKGGDTQQQKQKGGDTQQKKQKGGENQQKKQKATVVPVTVVSAVADAKGAIKGAEKPKKMSGAEKRKRRKELESAEEKKGSGTAKAPASPSKLASVAKQPAAATPAGTPAGTEKKKMSGSEKRKHRKALQAAAA